MSDEIYRLMSDLRWELAGKMIDALQAEGVYFRGEEHHRMQEKLSDVLLGQVRI